MRSALTLPVPASAPLPDRCGTPLPAAPRYVASLSLTKAIELQRAECFCRNGNVAVALPNPLRLSTALLVGNATRLVQRCPTPDGDTFLTSMMNKSDCCVLVVEDLDGLRDIIAMSLSVEGYTVVTAAEPMAALDAVEGSRPDVCLLDIGLPGMDGYDLATNMRRRRPDMLIITTSGNHREPEREAESGAAIDAFMLKPFSVDMLEKLIAQARDTRAKTAPDE